MSPEQNIKSILQHRGLAPKKKLGQNFLVNPRDGERIVDLARITPEDTVVEVGVGFGALTLPLAARARRVVGVEVDRGLIQWHGDEKLLPDNVTLVHQDILKADFAGLAREAGGRIKLIANLPYSISNPLLFRLVENQEMMEWAVLMLQKEVGQRLTAPVATKEYGVLTVLLGACAATTSLMTLGPNHFHPRPKVDSVVVRIDFRARTARLPDHDPPLLRRVVNAAFQQRRKTLRNALAGPLLGLDKPGAEEMLLRAGIAPQTRAERLTTADFIRLANSFSPADPESRNNSD